MAIAVDRRLQRLGYRRCDRSMGGGQALVVDPGDGTPEQHIRLLRLYRVEGAGPMATVAAFEHCAVGAPGCEQRFRVRLTDFPSVRGDGRRQVDAICSGASMPTQ